MDPALDSTAANTPGPTPPYQAHSMMAGMNNAGIRSQMLNSKVFNKVTPATIRNWNCDKRGHFAGRAVHGLRRHGSSHNSLASSRREEVVCGIPARQTKNQKLRTRNQTPICYFVFFAFLF